MLGNNYFRIGFFLAWLAHRLRGRPGELFLLVGEAKSQNPAPGSAEIPPAPTRAQLWLRNAGTIACQKDI